MGIEKYVGKVRAGLNAGARGLGNMVYDGLGDSLSSDVDVKGLVKKVGVSVLAGGMFVTSLVGGSAVRAEAGDFDDFMHGMIGSYVHESVKRHAQNSMDDYQSEDGGDDNSGNCYNRDQMMEFGKKVYDMGFSDGVKAQGERKLVVQYWKDFNGNGKLDSGENLGDVDGPVDLSKYGLSIELETASDEPITFFALDSEGNRVAFVEKRKISGYYNGSTNDWIKNLHTAGKNKADRYTVYAQQEGCSKVFKKSITTVRNRKNLSAK